jgi:hypothetical protein
MGRARIVEPEHVEVWAAPEALVIATSTGAGIRPLGEVGLRYGLTSFVELDGRVGTFGASIGPRLQLLRSPSAARLVDIALAPALAFTWPDKLAEELPVLIGFNLPGRHQIVVSWRLATQQHYGVGGIPRPVNFVYMGGSLGFAWQIMQHFALMPEVAVLSQVYADPGFSSNVAGAFGIQWGIGVLWDP